MRGGICLGLDLHGAAFPVSIAYAYLGVRPDLSLNIPSNFYESIVLLRIRVRLVSVCNLPLRMTINKFYHPGPSERFSFNAPS